MRIAIALLALSALALAEAPDEVAILRAENALLRAKIVSMGRELQTANELVAYFQQKPTPEHAAELAAQAALEKLKGCRVDGNLQCKAEEPQPSEEK